MNKYSGLNAQCSKCGARDINTRYCEYGLYTRDKCYGIKEEHLHRHCRNCGYEWFEETMSKPDELGNAINAVESSEIRRALYLLYVRINDQR